MSPRPYQPEDSPQCLALLPNLRLPTDYFVLAREGQILASGGYELTSPDTAQIVEYIVHPEWRRQGLGRFLIFFLLKQISALGPVARVHVQATPDSTRFFERQGFQPIGPGIYSKKLTVCA